MGESRDTGGVTDPTGPVEPPPEADFDDVSGLESVRERLREAVVEPATDDRLEAFAASGVLFHGPPGVGKTHIATALLGELGYEYLELTPAEIPLERPDAAARHIRAVYREAREHGPCVLLIDGLDVVAPAGERHRQVVAELGDVLDDLDDGGEVLFVATTTELGAVDAQVRRTGRVDLTIGMEQPDFRRRCRIVADELAAVEAAGVDVADPNVERIAGWTDGFSAADIVETIERAARKADGGIDENTLAAAVGELHDVESFRDPEAGGDEASDEETPSLGDLFGAGDDEDEGEEDETEAEGEDDDTDRGAVGRDGDRGAVVDGEATPAVGFDDIGGLDEVKQRLREAIEWPREYPEHFEALDVDTAAGILLYGPPGTGKTLLAKAVAGEIDSTFISVGGPELLDRYVGESERFVRQLFEGAQDAAPAVVFVDEIDAIAGERGGYTGGGGVKDSIVNQLLAEMDGLTGLEDVVVIGATNRVEVIDPALRRPGRFGRAIHVPPPDDEGRHEVFEIHTAERTLAEDVDVDWLVERTDAAYTGADVEAICERAAMNAIRDAVSDGAAGETPTITREHFERAIASVDPSGGRDGRPTGRAFR